MLNFDSLLPWKRDREPKQAYAPGTKLSYDLTLIDKFKSHHQALLSMFAKIQKSVDDRDFETLNFTLSRFKRLLEIHLLEENLRLYAYLNYCLKQDPDNHALVMSMKTEMKGIGRAATDFLQRYQKTGVDDDNVEPFGVELAAVGRVLVDRIEREESTLYSLYLPPDQYA